jgi:hypothetical protein
MNEKLAGGFQRVPTDSDPFVVAKVRLTKIAQYYRNFSVKAVAPYLSTAKRKAVVGC